MGNCGCNNRNGCFDVSALRIGEELCIDTRKLCLELTFSASRIGGSLIVTAGLLCSVETTNPYLRVDKNVVWLTPDMLGEEFDIYSNVDWRID